MTIEKLRKIAKKYQWESWLYRPFFGFMMSTFKNGNTERAFKKIGLPGWKCDFMFSDCIWYKSDLAYAAAKPVILKWFKHHSVKEISLSLEKRQVKWIKKIKEYSKEPNKNLTRKLKFLDSVLREITTYVWAVHAAEHFFTPILKQKVSKFISTDTNKYIGDISFPAKLNSAEKMVDAYRSGMGPALLAKNFGWMKARDGFSDPYKGSELADIAKHSLRQPKHKYPKIPKELETEVREARELVYLRTLRTDVYYELMFLVKPILKRCAHKYGIPFDELKYYDLSSLIGGKPKKYPPDFSTVSIGGKYYILDKPLFKNSTFSARSEIKGICAQKGKVKGAVKLLMDIQELGKVKKGDILVTYMTSPNFLPAMKLAAGFVTDEGGLTCHAAIVAREMKKPCIISTKIATKVFKDGDLVEVDADRGIVRKIS